MSSAVVYRWSERPEDKPMPLLARRRIIGSQAMISKVVLEAGCFVDTHAHENEQFGVILSGRLTFGLGRKGEPGYEERTLSAGEVVHLPSNVPHSARALERTEILDIFSPPSEKTGIDVVGR